MKPSGDFRKRVLAGEWLAGTFLNLASPITVEVAGLAGYDWLLLDHEHGPGGEDTLLHQLQAAATTPAFTLVRIAANETARFKRVLDAGAQGVMVPFINTAAEAQAAAAAVRYPPRGVRGVAKFHRSVGFGAYFEEYYQHSHEWIVLATQIETPEAIANIDAIAAVDGVDVLFVGPTDLSYTHGIPDQYENPRFVEILKKVVAAAKMAGKASGILVHNPALVEMCRNLGFTFASFGSDGGAVSAGLKANLAVLRGAKK